MKCRNRHVAKSTWEAWGEGDVERIRLSRRATLEVRHETRAVYPPGANAHACCEEKRTVIRLVNDLTTVREVEKLARILDGQCRHTCKPIRKVPGRHAR